MTFGQRLKYIIHYCNYTQKDLATTLNITENKISKLVTEKQKPSNEDLLLFSEFLHLTVDQLLGKDLYLDNLLEDNYDLENKLKIAILPVRKLLHQKQVFSLDDNAYFDILSVDVYNGYISYLDTVNRVKVKKTQEEIDKELAWLRETYPDAHDYLLEEYKREPAIRKFKIQDYGKTWTL